ncbi:hypothetical protein O9H85_08075 [Paenibacillus filicis]|uniref:Uncharacterized protein n=1 Tax=Paenibacillus gyeongsangnamensis TaxID=3388067 RepID=A0ABT4Q691_9BACL|nr:hypothetical protein [Paenibacillus filicis]MCZ8512389.1 hypothetical protein [Paenibacillus filicis]
MEKEKCPICEIGYKTEVRMPFYNRDIDQYNCKCCGEVWITQIALMDMHNIKLKERNEISAFTRERTVHKLSPLIISWEPLQDNHITTIPIKEIIDQFPKKISERTERALFNLSKLSDHMGQNITIDLDHDFPLFFCDAFNRDSIKFMLEILTAENYIKLTEHGATSSIEQASSYTITAHGWSKLYELETSHNPLSKQAFIAMHSRQSLMEFGRMESIELFVMRGLNHFE